MPVEHASQAVWRGVRFPDSDLVSLICRHVPRQGGAVVAGCGNGRHVRLLNELGFNASGIDADEAMVEDARANGVRATCQRLEDYHPEEAIDLLVAWGLVMIADIDQPERKIARIGARYIVANWRSPENTFAQQAATGGALKFDEQGVALCRVRSDDHLDDLQYRVHQLKACHFPGYQRLGVRTVSVTCDGVVNAWHQTVHRRQ